MDLAVLARSVGRVGYRRKILGRHDTAAAGSVYCSVCNSLPGLKRTALPGGMETSAPVRGLRPIPVLRGLTLKTPKPRSSMRSPCSRAFFIDSKTVSTAISAFVLVMPVRFTTSLMMSSLIKTALLAHRLGQPHDRIEFIPMSSNSPRVSGEEFRRACGRFATGVTIAAVLDSGGGPHGLTVSSFTSVSLEPPLVLICLGHDVSVISHFRKATFFGISVLAEHQQALSERFARKGQDRFDGVSWHPGITGVPLLSRSLSRMECAIHQRIQMGD